MGKNRGEKKKPFQWIRKHKKRSILIGIVLLVVIGIVSCGSGSEPAAVVTTAKAFRGGLQETVSTSGLVEAKNTKVYFAPAAGKIAKLNVEPGDAVKAGDVLIAYDETVLEREFRQASLEQDKAQAAYGSALEDSSENAQKFNEAETNLAVLEQQISDHKDYLKDLKTKLKTNQRDTQNALNKENYDLTRKLGELDPTDEKYARVKKDLERNEYLLRIADSTDYVTKLQDEIERVEEAIADFEAYKTKMEGQKSGSEPGVWDGYDKIQYEATRELAGIAYDQAQSAYNSVKSGVRAEFDGIVTEVEAVEGSPVTEGMKLLKLESSGAVKVTFQASKFDLAKLEIGQSAEVKISGNTYTGTVQKINRMASVISANTPMVGVEIHLDAPDERIILGMDAKIKIFTKEEDDALLIPLEAINADRDGDFLYVVENGVTVQRKIVCGISDDTYAVVLEGITEKDEIVVTSFTSLEAGMKVKVIPQD